MTEQENTLPYASYSPRGAPTKEMEPMTAATQNHSEQGHTPPLVEVLQKDARCGCNCSAHAGQAASTIEALVKALELAIDGAEAASGVIHSIEAQGLGLSPQQELEWEGATALIQEARAALSLARNEQQKEQEDGGE